MNTPDNDFEVSDSAQSIGLQAIAASNEGDASTRMHENECSVPADRDDGEWQTNFEREEALLEQLAAARQQLDDDLTSLADNESDFSRQMIESVKELVAGQRRHAAAREAAALAEIVRASQSLESRADALSAAQRALAVDLDKSRALVKEQDSAHRVLIATTRDALEARLALLENWTSEQAARTSEVHEQLDGYMLRLETRECEFAERLESLNCEWQRRIDDDRAVNRELTRANANLIEQTQQRIELAFGKLVAREAELAGLLHELKRVSEHHRQDREQYFALQLEGKQRAIDDLQIKLTVKEQHHEAAYAQLAGQVSAACSALPWRWMRPMRALQAQLAPQSGIKRSTANDEDAGTIASLTQPPQRIIRHAISDCTKAAAAARPTGETIPMIQTHSPASSLSELIALYDERFVTVAYHTLLRRAPDVEGMRYYLARLRSGISKAELIAQLHLSPEGRSARVKLPGLDRLMRSYRREKLLSPRNWFRQTSVTRAQERDNSIRAIENKLNVLSEAIQFQFAEMNRNLSHLNNVVATGALGASQAALALEAPAESTPSTVHDPIARRYEAMLALITPRFTAQATELSSLSTEIRISILMPVYKVPLKYLAKAIESVRYQSYSNWELCVVDDGSNDPALAQFLRDAAARDTRIRVSIEKTNRGIAGATNIALAMASGQYIALLDNDDMLTSDALHCVVSAIKANPDVEMLYSDECKIDEYGMPTELFTKPDWSPSMLFNCMYTGHLSVYLKTIADQVGGFRSAYDFSQDYDLALRVAEVAKCVHHIDRVLYGWRMIAGSSAQGDKPHARTTNVAALRDAAKRRNLVGEAFGERAANHFRVLVSALKQKVSIVIPSDNLDNIKESIASIVDQSLYGNYEILVVTNSKLIRKLDTPDLPNCVQLVSFDRPFNFSLKCNEGAARATGEIVIFFNDDVRVVSRDWIEMIIEGFAIDPNVGVVGPKLLYENYLIQHAGMVSGVRGLVGTAFHCLPHETDRHFSMAQWMREVSLICGACLAMRKDVFDELGGYDAVNAPISHSDVDLCFRVRESGRTCLYTPHATLIHIGHMSISETEKAEKAETRRGTKPKKDKSDIFLLRRWGKEVSYDPYFPPAMRDILYHDSPDAWQLYADVPQSPEGGKDILLVSHDLSGSGAPRVVFEMARVLREAGHFVVVASPTDGVFRQQLNDIGVPVIIDELLLLQHPSVERFAKNFDTVIANTVVTWPAVMQLSHVVDTYWYIHEISLLEHLLNVQPGIKGAFDAATGVWVGSEHAAVLVKQFRRNAEVLKYGVQPHRADPVVPMKVSFPLNVSLMGSYEPRKGQDLAVAAFGLLPPEYRAKLRLNLYGRILDDAFFRAVEASAQKLPEISIFTEIPYEQYVEELSAADAILIASRDDTLPLVSIDALGVAKVLMCTNTTGTSSYIKHGESGFISRSPSPLDIADMLREAVDRANDLPNIAMQGKQVFDEQFSTKAFTKAFFNACGVPAVMVTRTEYALA
ncbi:GT2 family glycosyltransferase/glycosyltransferase involved in cell wall biosynthesis [Paraburkholderia bannensis]|uniref:GT2 family glycosyltransferase/glycosyltransferase involved in cell wall biosynthesis n=1 Tax=Paraburkholderia bannensis TaxID=765414 RepID=A0A7W9TX55_9BURK|nr:MULTISPECIES: glycosyltransferase [Paraburkholderia]MBB3258040.1 GT2 family glycosyltransferase/glycosyltransferase involved in cell wall biosynthesis [Paraburkholderia sp. WP4_3_2]MBB6103053.1 GT2 family glycosyltransferase/glycosyltransferase involved in cell wall biosynthesis [Paraburkholderia bannensis]